MSAADPTGFSPVLDETESGYDERGVFADAMDEWTGTTPIRSSSSA